MILQIASQFRIGDKVSFFHEGEFRKATIVVFLTDGKKVTVRVLDDTRVQREFPLDALVLPYDRAIDCDKPLAEVTIA
jgi:hypothetical protein